MWGESVISMASIPLPDSDEAGWWAHRRFLTDLFVLQVPDTLLDLSAGGVGQQVVNDLVPTVRPVPHKAGMQADLVLTDHEIPDPDCVAQGGIAIVRDWPRDQPSSLPHTVLARGLGVVVPHGEAGWGWLLSVDFARWSVVYTVESGDEVRRLRHQALELNDALKEQTRRVEVAERELLRARDEMQQLLPLEVSPKAQLRALSRSVPFSVRRRLTTFRRQPTPKATRRRDHALAALKKTSLSTLLDRHYDPQWTGMTRGEYMEKGLPDGLAVNSAHADRLDPHDDAVDSPTQLWGPIHLVTSSGRTAGSIPELVAMADPRLVTVDVWDTLVARRRPADAAKLATARRMTLIPAPGGRTTDSDPFDVLALRVAVEARLAAADPVQEYELTHVVRETLRDLWGDVPQVPEVAEQLAEAEVADEIAWTEARDDVAALADMPRLAIASDFYMRTEELARVIRSAAPDWKDVPVYVSVDRHASKRLGGGLLDLIRRDFNVAPQEHLHIGDNVHSDVDVQVAAGGSAIQVQPATEFPAPGEFSTSDLAACSAHLRRALAEYDKGHPTDDQHELAGRAVSPLAVALVARALEQAYRAGVDRVHYVSREGIFLAEVHRLVEPLLRPPGVAAVAPIHLALSRRATFGASLQAPFRFSLQRMWSMYARQSVKALLVSIGLDPLDFEPAVRRAGLELDEIVGDARRDQRVAAFLEDPDVEARISVHVESSRSLLRRYVTSRTSLQEPFILVDIGWRGTIQDNVVRALGIRSSIGVYLGLYPFLNAQPVGSAKIGAAFDGNLGEDFEFSDPPAVLERPWTPDLPSTVGFREADGEVEPVLDKEPGFVSPGIARFQSGTLAVAPLVAEWMDGFGLTAEVLRPEIYAWARELWSNPLPGLADIWFASDHDDSFGALNVTSFGKEMPSPEWLEGDLYQHVKAGMAASSWPEGYRAWLPVRSIVELANL